MSTRARQQGLDPLTYCDEWRKSSEDMARADLSYDDFIGRTQPRHKAAVTEMVSGSRRSERIYDGCLRRVVLRRV